MSFALKREDVAPAATASFAPNRGESPAPGAAPILTMGQHELTETLTGALRSAFEGQNASVKQAARAANANVETAKSWWNARSCPDALHLLRMMATIPAVRAEVRRLVGMHNDLDPEFERDMLAMMGRFAQLRDRAGDPA